MPLRKHAQEMRDLYANEIAKTVSEGGQPSADQVASWVKYDAAARGENTGAAFRSGRSTQS